MKIKTTFALAIAALAIGVPVATADPDTYRSAPGTNVQPDAVDRYVANASRNVDAQPDALDRYLRSHSSGAATHLDSPGVRAGGFGSSAPVSDSGRSWTSAALFGLGGGLVLLLAVAGASATRERRASSAANAG
jgi:hypothetical protein